MEHIYNFDLPKENNQYIHRIGRTARAGKDGKAISLLSVREEIEFVGMAKSFGFKLKAQKTPDFERIQIEHLEKKQRTNQQSNRRSNSSFSNKTNNRRSNNKSFGNKKNVNFVSFKDVSNLQRRPNRFRKN